MRGIAHPVRPVTGAVSEELCQFCKFPGLEEERPCEARFSKIVHQGGRFLRACGVHGRMAELCGWKIVGHRKK